MEQEITLKDLYNSIEKSDKKLDILAQIVTKNQEETNKKFDALTEIVIKNQENTDQKFEGLTETILDSFDRVHDKIDTTNVEMDQRFAKMKIEMDAQFHSASIDSNRNFAKIEEKIEFQALGKRTDILETQMKIVQNRLGLV